MKAAVADQVFHRTQAIIQVPIDLWILGVVQIQLCHLLLMDWIKIEEFSRGIAQSMLQLITVNCHSMVVISVKDEWIFLHFLQNKHALLLSKFSFGIDLISMLKTAKQVFVRDKLVEYNFKRPFLWTDSCIQFKICWRISISYFLLLCSFLKFAGLKYMDWTKNSFHKWLIQ